MVASFNGSPDYAATQGKPLTFTIHPATPSVTVADAGRTYNGSAFAATALIAGVVRGIDNTPATDLENTGLGLTYYVGPKVAGQGTATAPRGWHVHRIGLVQRQRRLCPGHGRPVTFTIKAVRPAAKLGPSLAALHDDRLLTLLN